MSRSQQLALDFVEAELGRELELRASLEQRAGGLISTYSAVVAAGVAIAALIRTDTPVNEGLPLVLVCLGGVVALVGLLSAVVALTPINVGAIPLEDLNEMIDLATSDEDSDRISRIRQEDVARALVEAIGDAQGTVKVKAIATLISAISLVSSLGAFAAGVFIAL